MCSITSIEKVPILETVKSRHNFSILKLIFKKVLCKRDAVKTTRFETVLYNYSIVNVMIISPFFQISLGINTSFRNGTVHFLLVVAIHAYIWSTQQCVETYKPNYMAYFQKQPFVSPSFHIQCALTQQQLLFMAKATAAHSIIYQTKAKMCVDMK